MIKVQTVDEYPLLASNPVAEREYLSVLLLQLCDRMVVISVILF